MKKKKRRVIAFIAGSLITGKKSSYLFDHSTSSYANMGGVVSSRSVSVYDYDRSCYVTGTGSVRKFSLYDYGTSYYVELRIRGNRFEGYDYETSTYFSGKVTGNVICFFDHQYSNYYHYST